MRAYRDIATLSALQILCFLLLTHLEPDFFMLHLYQTIIYEAILLMLFYTEDRWAYMIGILAPAAWLVLAYESGLLGAALRQLFRLTRAQAVTNQVSLVAGIIVLLSLLMIGFCAYRWKRHYSGLGKGLNTFLISLAIVVVYYGILVVWFWNRLPKVAT
jgi:hydrogenase-4 membrane subunit HyfE